MFILNQNNSIANQFLAELRSIHIQKDRLRFRKNLERVGEILAYEVSKELPYSLHTITSPLAQVETPLLKEQPVIIAVLRAAIPFYQGILNFFDHADSGFIGAYRKEGEEQIEISLNYLASPDLTEKTVIMVDPMLATGKSFLKSIEALKGYGKPKQIEIVCAFAAPEGLEHIQENLELPYRFWIGALDEKLNQQSYIVPGLGDAGDLAFGPKI
ncbi:uracil phosphoribosyltransferase [Cyclobacterium marinum]|uniref:Phosphoribosyltransferase n=1 Tax=Cyclobacterium marinum (strain ATCC 25205 / DSM 745 / LMG 13164 / NCIMB 1802) TaxID=880070 RepID=G0IVS9_CYCMS|nr:uracil phosphoribosyltransferase [Cyclobacterium marinum]AEL24846.1 phosphoribosyltransferase [Cyclobacterium marinum DSM 745]